MQNSDLLGEGDLPRKTDREIITKVNGTTTHRNRSDCSRRTFFLAQ